MPRWLLRSLPLLLILHTTVGTAGVISVDWKTSGDNLLTRDLNNGLEWLDLFETMAIGDNPGLNQNRSFNDVSSQFGTGGEFEGFRHATTGEIVGLWVSAGIPDIDVNPTVANFVPVSNLIALLSDTSPNLALSSFSFGILADSNSPGTHASAMIEAFIFTGLADTESFEINVGDTNTNINGGHFLVRAVVPEPSSLVLFTLGTVVLGFMERRRRKLSRR